MGMWGAHFWGLEAELLGNGTECVHLGPAPRSEEPLAGPRPACAGPEDGLKARHRAGSGEEGGGSGPAPRLVLPPGEQAGAGGCRAASLCLPAWSRPPQLRVGGSASAHTPPSPVAFSWSPRLQAHPPLPHASTQPSGQARSWEARGQGGAPPFPALGLPFCLPRGLLGRSVCWGPAVPLGPVGRGDHPATLNQKPGGDPVMSQPRVAGGGSWAAVDTPHRAARQLWAGEARAAGSMGRASGARRGRHRWLS